MSYIIKFYRSNHIFIGIFFSNILSAATQTAPTNPIDFAITQLNTLAISAYAAPQLADPYIPSSNCLFSFADQAGSLLLCDSVNALMALAYMDACTIPIAQGNTAECQRFGQLFTTMDQNLKTRGASSPNTWEIMANLFLVNPGYAIPTVVDFSQGFLNAATAGSSQTQFNNLLAQQQSAPAVDILSYAIDMGAMDSQATQLGVSSKVFPPLLATYVPQSIRSSTDITQRIPAIQQFQQIIWNAYKQAPNALLSAMQSTYASSSSTNIQNNFWDLVVPNLPATQAVSIQSIAPAGWPVITTSVYSANTAMVTALNGAYKIDQGATLEMLISLVNAALPSNTPLSLTNTWQAVATFVTNASCSAPNAMSNCGKAVSAAQTAFGTAVKNSTQSNPINGIAIWNALMPVTQLQGATITDPNEQALFILLVPYASLMGQQIQNLLSQAYIYYQIEQLLAELAGITSPTLATYWSNIASVLPTTPLAGNSSSQINALISQATKTLGADSSSHAISSVPPSSNSQMMSNLLNFVSKLFSQINFQLGVSGSSYTSAQNAMTDLANGIATIPNLIAKAKTSKKMPAGATVANGGIYSGFATLLTAYSPTAGIQNPLMTALTYINNNL